MKIISKKLSDIKIEVTEKGYDNISEILDLLNVKYSPFSGKYECDILFINCNTRSKVDSIKLKSFIERGGVLYASDWASQYVQDIVPESISFTSSIRIGTIKVEVLDNDLAKHLGKSIDIKFDMPSWKKIKHFSGGKEILVSSKTKNPIMVEIPYFKGTIFYTSFHNHGITTENEEKLLQLLILKQVGSLSSSSIEEIAKENQLNLEKLNYKKKMAGYQPLPETVEPETKKFKIGKTEKTAKFTIVKQNSKNDE
jgi:hypothetical protein